MATRKSKQQPIDDPTAGWKYRWNDSDIDEMTYNKLIEEHRQWIEEQTRLAIEAAKAEAKLEKRKKK